MLGTFAMYYPEPRAPLSSDFELITSAGHIARIAIEVEQSHLALCTGDTFWVDETWLSSQDAPLPQS